MSEPYVSKPTYLNTKLITIRRDERDRRNLGDLSSIQSSIKTIGQITPICVRRDGDEIVLVAGERRLQSCINLGIDVRVEFWEDLTPEKAKEIELEENLKREDLDWRDEVRSTAALHEIYCKQNEDWNVVKTADRLSISHPSIYIKLTVAKNLNNTLLKDAQGITHAYSLLQRAAERRSAQIVETIAEGAQAAFGAGASHNEVRAEVSTTALKLEENTALEQGETLGSKEAIPANLAGAGRGEAFASMGGSQNQPPAQALTASPPPILNLSFLDWVQSYSGPKFNLIHCDFPFGIKFTGGYGQEEDGVKYESKEEDYWELVDALCLNTEKIASYSSHLVFWFSMTFYTETVKRLRAAGWKVHDFPYIWYKSDGQGIIPGRNEYMRRVYETALICSRGKRPLVKMIDNTYAAPRPANSIHPSMKPEPMLRHLFSGLVDATTDVLDPTCGSASALRAAEDVGARSILGLEINAEYHRGALSATLNARTMRKLSGKA